jgi:hypothetical protein
MPISHIVRDSLVRKKLYILLAVLQLVALQISAVVTSHVAFDSAWTWNGIAEYLNDELNRIQEYACNEGKFFELLDISIIPPKTSSSILDIRPFYIYIFYDLSDKGGETNSLITQVVCVSGSPNSVAEKLQKEINSLQNLACDNKIINILYIKVIRNFGYIIYEITH